MLIPKDDATGAPGSGLVDRWGRVHRSLRISVTDACNIRCQYCMPAVDVPFLPRERLLSYEAIARIVRVAAAHGVHKARITGGEPLMRPGLDRLIAMLARIEPLSDLALTTNGMLLAPVVADLAAAGLRRVNISLDTLSDATFRQMSRRDGLRRVLDGIDAARATAGLHVKLNALVLRDVNLDDVVALVEFACERQLEMRFIEFMPLDGDRRWSTDRMVRGDELRSLIASRLGPLRPVEPSDPAQPARDYELVRHGGRVGFIDSVSHPFCGGCDRLRLTADGKLRNCLFGREEWDVAAWAADAAADEASLVALLRACLAAKHPSHGIADADFQPPRRAMYQIGG